VLFAVVELLVSHLLGVDMCVSVCLWSGVVCPGGNVCLCVYVCVVWCGHVCVCVFVVWRGHVCLCVWSGVDMYVSGGGVWSGVAMCVSV